MAQEPRLDPRYDPQFQRGFDPARDAAPVRRGPMRLEGGPPPTAPRVPDPPPLVEREPDPPALEVDIEEEAPPARPRLEWALLGTGIVLLVAAAMLFVGAVELSDRYSGWLPGFEGQLYGAATSQLPGPLLVGGVLAIVAWIVIRAVSAERRSR
jgi:hypothetical protein